MFKAALGALLATVALAKKVAPSTQYNTVWPQPQVMTVTEGAPDTPIFLNQYFFNFTGVLSPIAYAASIRYYQLMSLNPYTNTNMDVSAVPETISTSGAGLSRCFVHIDNQDPPLQLGVTEYYEINIGNSSCLIKADNCFGALRAFETLAQLVAWPSASHQAPVFRQVPLSIFDFPSYPHRGLLIDTSRHFQPVELIKAQIDAMAYNKFNVLHWHLVDDQSFPFQSTTFPSLSQKGAYSPSAVYSHADVSNIIDYALYRGVRVIPEFDVPGHTSSWLIGEPALQGSAACDMDPTLDSTYSFLKSFFTETSSLFKDKYAHFGGDEVQYNACWNTSATIRGWMSQHKIAISDLQAYFEQRLVTTLSSLPITPMFWQEVFQNGAVLPKESVIEVWEGQDYETLYNVLQSGLKAVMSGGYYLDHLGDTWDVFYTRPLYNFTLPIPNPQNLLGAEACMWGESVDVTNVLSRVWPRASAVGEVTWNNQVEKDPYLAGPRLHKWRCQMNLRGVPAEPVGVWWNADRSWCDWELY